MLADAAETEAIIEGDLNRLRKLGGRLRALASAGRHEVATRLADVCADAFAEVDRPLWKQLRTESIPADLCVVGTAAALTTAIASLMEHAVAASPVGAAVNLTVRVPRAAGAAAAEGDAAFARRAGDCGNRGAERRGARFHQRGAPRRRAGQFLPELRGDGPLILAGAILDAVGGAVHIASDANSGLVLALHLLAC